jgi:hypothetical protein
LPFIEQMGTWTSTRKEFTWEREWRHLGDFVFEERDVALVLCPEAEIEDFEAIGNYSAIDPSWSLERMINALASGHTRARGRLARAITRIARLTGGS